MVLHPNTWCMIQSIFSAQKFRVKLFMKEGTVTLYSHVRIWCAQKKRVFSYSLLSNATSCIIDVPSLNWNGNYCLVIQPLICWFQCRACWNSHTTHLGEGKWSKQIRLCYIFLSMLCFSKRWLLWDMGIYIAFYYLIGQQGMNCIAQLN